MQMKRRRRNIYEEGCDLISPTPRDSPGERRVVHWCHRWCVASVGISLSLIHCLLCCSSSSKKAIEADAQERERVKGKEAKRRQSLHRRIKESAEKQKCTKRRRISFISFINISLWRDYSWLVHPFHPMIDVPELHCIVRLYCTLSLPLALSRVTSDSGSSNLQSLHSSVHAESSHLIYFLHFQCT